MTDTNLADGQILRADTRGRVRTPAAGRESLLFEFWQSGLSGAKFAELSRIKYRTFATWLQKRQRQAKVSAKPEDSVHCLEAVVERVQTGEGQNQAPLVVELPGGVRVLISKVKQASPAAASLRSLVKPC